MERVGGAGWKADIDIYPTCPRCGSSNTKFCYYNNYSLTQPRYFCKGCRRYWTKGGSLRNIPVGGGCRKTRRERKSSSRITTPATMAATSLIHPPPRTTSINIDLAQVYANFVNPQQQPEPETNGQVQGLVMTFPASSTTDHHQQLVLSQDTCFGPFTSTDDHEFAVSYINNDHEALHGFYGFNSISSLSQQRDCLFGQLPPLPGEEMGWSHPQNSGIISDVHPVTSADGVLPPSSIQTGEVLDPNLLLGSGDAFDNYEALFSS